MSKRTGSKQGEIADREDGAANIAANLATENSQPAVTPAEPGKRGRKPSTALNVVRFQAMINGEMPVDETRVTVIPSKTEGGRYIPGGLAEIQPHVEASADGGVNLVRFLTVRGKAHSEVLASLTGAEILAQLNERYTANSK